MACECDSTDACPSGSFGCGCCCASVTGLRAGLPPDVIKTAWTDMYIDTADTATRTHATRHITSSAAHIVSITASLVCVHRDTDGSDPEKQLKYPTSAGAAHIAQATPCMFSLFTLPGVTADDLNGNRGGWDAADDENSNRNHFVTAGLSAHAPSWESPPDLFGYFCDGGIFIEMNAPHNKLGIRVVVNYVDRLQFPAAYHDPIKVLQHYWSCSNETEFLEGFYGGTSFDVLSSDTQSGTTDEGTIQSSQGTNPFTFATSTPSVRTQVW